MYNYKNYLLFMTIFFLPFLFNCGGEVTPSLNLQQKAARLLEEGSPWGGPGNVEVVSLPSGVDPADLASLQLIFKSSGADDWAPTFIYASGADEFISTLDATWAWTGAGTDNISLSGASVPEFTSVDVTDEAITFSFEVNSNSGGRTTGIEGSYRVKLQ